MARFRTFLPLRKVNGVDKITNVREYKKADEDLTGEGLCAAMSMRWLQKGAVATTDDEFADLHELQDAYQKILKEKTQNCMAIGTIAEKCALKVVVEKPGLGTDRDGIRWWKMKEIVGDTLGTKIAKYVNGELTLRAERPLPCFILFNLDVANAEVNGLPVPVPSGAHAVALKRGDDNTYHYYDPDVGVYVIDEDAVQRFFDTVHACYKDFYNHTDMDAWLKTVADTIKEAQDSNNLDDDEKEVLRGLEELFDALNKKNLDGEELTLNADVDLQIVRIYGVGRAKYNRFRPLKGGNGQGFKQIKDVTQYKQLAAAEAGSEPDGDELIIGAGLCAAMVMHWLRQGEVPTTNQELSDLARLQKVFDQNSKAGAIKAVQTLAKAHSFNVPGCFPDGLAIEECIAYWNDIDFDTFGTAISMYVSGKLISNLRPADHLPCLIWVQGVFQATVNGIAPMEQLRQLKKRIQDDFSMKGHVFALRPTNSGYQFYDPNAGVYEIVSDAWLKVFFDTVYDCYKNARVKDLDKLNRELSQADGPKVDVKGEMDLQLVRIFPVWPQQR